MQLPRDIVRGLCGCRQVPIPTPAAGLIMMNSKPPVTSFPPTFHGWGAAPVGGLLPGGGETQPCSSFARSFLRFAQVDTTSLNLESPKGTSTRSIPIEQVPKVVD